MVNENSDRDSSKYLQREDVQGHLKVLEVLREWDPIGVIDLKCPGSPGWDEYDSYAPTLIQMLDNGGTDGEIVKWMHYVVTDYMGMSVFDEKHSRVCAKKLVEFWKGWKSGSD